MKPKKWVKKALPCSFYDIEGIHSWLDEMALQGLFLDRLSYHNDRAFFTRGDPRPVRYRLDPLGKDWNDVERKENYAQMGWEFVDAVPRYFYIFSCDDPNAPELYSDPATLSYALKGLARRHVRTNLIIILVFAALIGVLLLMTWHKFQTNLILWEYPFMPLNPLLLVGTIVLLMVDSLLTVRRLRKVCRTLEDGLTLKAGRRHWRPNVPFLALYLPFLLVFNLLNSYALQYTTVEYLDLDLATLSHPWPDLVQLENAQPSTPHPERYSYMKVNRSPAAPIQEYYVNRWGISLAWGAPSLQVWHYQTNSPSAARRLYRLERNELDKDLRDNAAYPNSSESITDLIPLTPQDHPELDILETASFRHLGQKGWSFTCLRENEILLVRYSGSASLEDGLELFLNLL